MGIIRTDKWLDESFGDMRKVEDHILETVHSQEQALIETLKKTGMYRPNKRTKVIYEQMKERAIWDEAEGYFKKYQKEWNGPDIPIFIFPVAMEGLRLFRPAEKRKAGLAFVDKLFLFVSGDIEKKELEALFVHEYHHATRLSILDERMESNLASSIVMEGLAEYAVSEYCGTPYLAPWTKRHTTDEVRKRLKSNYVPNFELERNDPLHDRLLFGGGGVPKMGGYEAGYRVVKDYAEYKGLKTKALFTHSAKDIISRWQELAGEQTD
ncbi:DUF2268 domain-containing protein [Bacillus sp. FJAT-27916]|mgnify:CR=1 FL=1|uniref:DUF2268 domain-containing protein n=1 Tax=Bacillus sp. FJAT-27916 TaxID=1679169 RepID=UPI0006715A3F|nr:DUF2268 domain-containing putative Zn-dependent protease [Bacillus sp. FJAT-27916]